MFISYVIVVLLLVLLPINNQGSKLNHTFVLQLRLDYLFHALLFLPWMFFKPKRSVTISTTVWLSTGLAFAMFAEGVQYLVPYRAFNVNDLIANCTGILVSALFLCLPLVKQHA